MRFSFGFLTAILLLFGFAGECQAQNLTGGFPTLTAGGRDLDSLKAAFNSAPKLVIKPAGSEAFYDVAIENICDGPVDSLARDWANHQFGSSVLDQVALITASVELPDGGRTPFQNPIPILVEGNASYVSSQCRDVTIRGVPRGRRVKVILVMTLAQGVPSRAKNAAFELADAAADYLPGGWLVQTGTHLGIKFIKTFVTQGKETQQALAEKGAVYPDPRKPQPKPPEINDQVAEAHYMDQDKEWIRLMRYPRAYLLNYGPCQYQYNVPGASATVGPCKSFSPGTVGLDAIPDQVNLLLSPYTKLSDAANSWNALLQTAGAGTLDLSQSQNADKFCASIRNALQEHLIRPTEVSLALYVHFRQHHYEFSGDRANRGCLFPAELNDLVIKGYIPPAFGF
jgi:hypothetical protein